MKNPKLKLIFDYFKKIITNSYYIKILSFFLYKTFYVIYIYSILVFKLLSVKLNISTKENLDLWIGKEGKLYNDVKFYTKKDFSENLNKNVKLESEFSKEEILIIEKNLNPHEVLHILNRRQKSKYYLPSFSYIPFFLSMFLGYILFGIALLLHSKDIISFLSFTIIISIFSVLLAIYFWIKLFYQERLAGEHTAEIKRNITMGFYFFLLTEAMCFLALFWTFFHNLLAASNHIGGYNPGAGIVNFYVNETLKINYLYDTIFYSFVGEPHLIHMTMKTFTNYQPSSVYIHFNVFDKGRLINPYGVPLFNTFILLSSAASLNAAHKAIRKENFSRNNFFLLLTILLGLFFVGVQFYEYKNCNFSFNDGIYACAFLSLTGLHGFHVILGVLALFFCFLNFKKKNYAPKYHQSFEFAIWYWHFVDVIWIAVYLLIYLWPAAYFFKAGVFGGKAQNGLYVLNFSLDYLKLALNYNYDEYYNSNFCESLNSFYFCNKYTFKDYFIDNKFLDIKIVKNFEKNKFFTFDIYYEKYLYLDKIEDLKKSKYCNSFISKFSKHLAESDDTLLSNKIKNISADGTLLSNKIKNISADDKLPIFYLQKYAQCEISEKSPLLYSLNLFDNIVSDKYDKNNNRKAFQAFFNKKTRLFVYLITVDLNARPSSLFEFYNNVINYKSLNNFDNLDIDYSHEVLFNKKISNKKISLINQFFTSLNFKYFNVQPSSINDLLKDFVFKFNNYNEECYRKSTPAILMVFSIISHEISLWVAFFDFLDNNKRYVDFFVLKNSFISIYTILFFFILYRFIILPFISFNDFYFFIIKFSYTKRLVVLFIFYLKKFKKVLRYNIFVLCLARIKNIINKPQ